MAGTHVVFGAGSGASRAVIRAQAHEAIFERPTKTPVDEANEGTPTWSGGRS